MKKKIFQFAVLIFALAPLLVRAGGDEVILIYNSRVPESREVADYYAQRRNVPTNQIFGFDITTNVDMSRAEFRDALQKPLVHELEARKLWHIGSLKIPATNGAAARVEKRVVESKIRYAVVCYGVPFRISPDSSLKEKVEETMRLEFQNNNAGVDSELACLPLIEMNLPLTGPLISPVFGVTNEAVIGPLSGILLVTRLDGPTPAIARGLVDKAIQAESEGMWGRAYFDERGISNPTMKPGDHGTTFGGGPFVTSVALHVLDRLSDPGMLKHVRETGVWFGKQLHEIAHRTSRIRQVRGVGFMWGVDVMGTAAHVVSEALGHGLLVCSAGDYTVRLIPPLVMTQDELARGLQILEEIL